jgi:predicted TPR repeat methyltransferase
VSRFDEAYYRRFYEAKNTRVSGPEEVSNLCGGALGMIRWLGGDVSSVLDVGAGTGLWRDWFRAHVPDAHYRSIEASDYACRRYRHEKADIATFRASERFDLVVCQGVLPYLSDADAERAIDNIGAMARGFLYFEAITVRDLETVCDRARTDVHVHARSRAFYATHLGRHFRNVGCGLHYKKDGPLQFYELETCGS